MTARAVTSSGRWERQLTIVGQRKLDGFHEGVKEAAVHSAAVTPADDEGSLWPLPKELIQRQTVSRFACLTLERKTDESDPGYGWLGVPDVVL